MQRLLTLAAGGCTRADCHQAAVGPYDLYRHEWPLFEVQMSLVTRERFAVPATASAPLELAVPTLS